MPTSALYPDTTERSQPTSSTRRQPHWVCVEVDDHPFIALCGYLTSGDRTAKVTNMHDECRELALAHSVSCAGCAHWARILL